MSILGKVLIVLNILAAIAFVGLAGLDWGKRQEWSYAVLRQEIALNGLPLDDKETLPDGTPIVSLLSDQTMQDIFRSAGGISQPLKPEDKTQLAALDRAKTRLLGEIEAVADEPAKRKKIAAILLPLTDTIGERDQLAAQIEKQPIEALLGADGPLEQAFARPKDASLDRDRRREAIAHVLLNTTDPNSTDYQRALAVVGFEAFAAEAERQGVALRDMAHRVLLAVNNEAGIFEAEYNRVVADLRYLADRLVDRQSKLAEYQDLATRQHALLTKRQTDVSELRAQIDQARQATAASLTELAAEQQRLFDAQRAVAAGVAKNLELEQQIRQQERPTSEGK